MLRSIIEFSNKMLGRLKSGRQIDVPKGVDDVRVNLGCALSVVEGWVNIDGSLNALIASMPSAVHAVMYGLTGSNQYYTKDEYCSLLSENIFIHHDLSYGIPLKDDVADYIYSSHFLEHLYRDDARHLLNESYRVLKKGGVVRISIPDLEYAIKLYSLGKKDQTLQNYFFVESDDSYYARHKYMYDFEMLSEILKDIGFNDIKRCDYQQGETPDIDILDNRKDESLFVEARK